MSKGKSCLLALVIVDKSVNEEAFRSTMSTVWKPEGWIQFKKVEDNRMLVEFQYEQDKSKCYWGGIGHLIDYWCVYRS